MVLLAADAHLLHSFCFLDMSGVFKEQNKKREDLLHVL